jgi:hypothetical protein
MSASCRFIYTIFSSWVLHSTDWPESSSGIGALNKIVFGRLNAVKKSLNFRRFFE